MLSLFSLQINNNLKFLFELLAIDKNDRDNDVTDGNGCDDNDEKFQLKIFVKSGTFVVAKKKKNILMFTNEM